MSTLKKVTEGGLTDKRRWLLLGSIAVVLVLVSIIVVVQVNSNRWKKDFTVKYVGSETYRTLTGETSTLYIYEITNNTNKTLYNVTAVFKFWDRVFENRKYTYETKLNVYGTVKAHETVELKISRLNFDAAADANIMFFEHELDHIKYSRRK